MNQISCQGASLSTRGIKTRYSPPLSSRKAIIEPIPAEFVHDGFTYRQIARQGMVAIYRQGQGPSAAYEVVIIQQYPEQEMFGKHYPAREAMPRSEQWGSQGWTFTSEEKAFAKLKELARKDDTKC
jgi:hypothetical protein